MKYERADFKKEQSHEDWIFSSNVLMSASKDEFTRRGMRFSWTCEENNESYTSINRATLPLDDSCLFSAMFRKTCFRISIILSNLYGISKAQLFHFACKGTKNFWDNKILRTKFLKINKITRSLAELKGRRIFEITKY